MSLSPPASPLRPGSRLDRYELLCLVAEGGMASVWVARLFGKHGFEKLVAIKTILPKFAADPLFRQMFLDEARIASGIEHSNVARILDLGEEFGALYLVMEWVDGDSFTKVQRLLARKGVALPHGIVLRIMADACAGLHAAHELRGRDGTPLGVVHRDVSPQNILVNVDGVAKIIDFGIAKALDRTTEDTDAGTLKGKIQYMAPEQALGKSIDRRADVWAVGAVLYNFFAGRPVYDAESQLAMLQKLTAGKPPPPLPSKVPAPIAMTIANALRFAPEQRWATAAELRRQIEKAMVEVGCAWSSADVAGFIAEYLPERSSNRRQTIERAILAANERVVLPQEPPSIQSASGLMDVHSRTPASLVTAPLQAGGAPENSNATLGSAALESPQIPMARPGRLGLVLGAVGAAGVVAAGAFALVHVLHAPPPRANANAQPPPPVVAAPLPADTGPQPKPPSTTTVPIESIPVSALPVASAPVPTQANRPTRSPSGGRDAAAPKKKTIDDGF